MTKKIDKKITDYRIVDEKVDSGELEQGPQETAHEHAQAGPGGGDKKVYCDRCYRAKASFDPVCCRSGE